MRRDIMISAEILTAPLATGCSMHDWTRPQATLAEFTADHRECLEANRLPVTRALSWGTRPILPEVPMPRGEVLLLDGVILHGSTTAAIGVGV